MKLLIWRHPRPIGADGRCVGRRSDLAVDARKAKRLAHRIRMQARRDRLPAVVVTSTARRTRAVGRVLRGWGWRHRIDGRLDELDFGDWDGRPWADIGAGAVQAWCDDFGTGRAGGGESVVDLLTRCTAWWRASTQPSCIVVGHGGWISAARWLQAHASDSGALPQAAQWPAAPRYAELVVLESPVFRPAADRAASAS